MTDDRSLERAARSWLEEGPTKAPDRPVEAALSRIPSTRQDRDLWIPWRLPTMPTSARLAAAAAVLVVLGAGILILTAGSQNSPRPVPTQTTSPSPSAATARPIANGTYAASLPVADILRRLDADASMTAAEKTAVIDDILGIRGATTLNVEVTVTDATFTAGYATDGEATQPEASWKLYILDPATIAVDIGTESSGIQAYRVTSTNGSFTLRAVSPADPVESFVRSVLFETAQFSPV